MKALAISGGSTKISFLAGTAIELMKLNDYDIITGISAGSIISILLAIKHYDILETSILTATEDDFFKVKPVNSHGKLTIKAVIRAITGKHSLGKYSLDKLLKKFYTPAMHDQMMLCGKIVKVGAVNLNLVRIEYCDITKVDFETAIKWVVASASIPIMTEPVKIGEHYYCDGGVMEHVGGVEAIDSGATSLDVIFSRPETPTLTESDIEWKPKNLFSVATRVLDVMPRNITVENESEIKLECMTQNLPLNIFYTPFTLTGSLYKIDTDLSRSWYQLGKDLITNPSTDNEYHNNLGDGGDIIKS